MPHVLFTTHYGLLFTLLLASQLLCAQTLRESVSIRLGLDFLQHREQQFTAASRSGFGYQLGVSYERAHERSAHRFTLDFLYTRTGKGRLSSTNVLLPELRYAFFRHLPNEQLQVGGYVDAGSLLNFRSGVWASENAISYTVWSSIGPAVRYGTALGDAADSPAWHAGIRLPLLAYVVRPSYTFPYPDDYLRDDTFRFDRAGLGGSLLSGGRIVSLDRFQRIALQVGINWSGKNSARRYGFDYGVDYFGTRELKSIRQWAHRLSLTTQFGQ